MKLPLSLANEPLLFSLVSTMKRRMMRLFVLVVAIESKRKMPDTRCHPMKILH